MLIRTRMGISADGFIATPDGIPAFAAIPGFIPHGSYDWPAFARQCQAVVLGRVALDAGLQAVTGGGDWPWPGMHVYVLTSRPVPSDVPADVVVSDPTPEGLLGRLRSAGLTGDAFLLGGRRTLQAMMAAGGIDKLELLKLPVLLGDGVPFSAPGTTQRLLRLDSPPRAFPDGTIHLAYTFAP